MKKLLLFFVLIMGIAAYAGPTDFSFNLQDQNIATESAEDHFSEWFSAASGSSFVKFRDVTDRFGTNHKSYQQYIDGVAVEGALVLVHSKNGLITSANGSVLSDVAVPAVAAPKRIQAVRKSLPSSNAEYKIVPIYTDSTVEYKRAYLVTNFESSCVDYFDAETGELLQSVSMVKNAVAQGTAKTYYSGTKAIECSLDTGVYTLYDENRNILTYIGNRYPSAFYGLDPSSYAQQQFNSFKQTLPNEILTDSALLEFTSRNWYMLNLYGSAMNYYCSKVQSSTPNFTGSKLTSITINSISNTDWIGLEDSSRPDLYIIIKDGSGIERYNNKASYIPSATLPRTFNVNVPLWGDDYRIYLMDYDAYSTNDTIAKVRLTSTQPRTGSWSGSSSGTLTVVGNESSPVLDVHWGMSKTYDFFLDVFNQHSFDGLGSPIFQLVNPPSFMIDGGNNAFATFKENYWGYMVYGMGNGSLMNPVVSIEVLAHEYSHLVTDCNGNGGLIYRNESGALNESFSDIFGISVKNYVTGSNNWLIGDNGLMVSYTNMRSMKNPSNSMDGNSAQPKYYKGNNWSSPGLWATIFGNDDHGGVHSNSGVQNYWFYLLSEGKQGVNERNVSFSVKGIGIEKAQQIAYQNLMYYLTPNATYADAVAGSKLAAQDLYGANSTEYKSVVNAWYAVGLSNIQYDQSFELTPGTYAIVASRGNSDGNMWYYMTSDLGSASTKRYQANSTGVTNVNSVNLTNLPANFIWELEANGSNWKLKNGTSYSTWTSGNSANFDATGKSLTIDVVDDHVQIHFNDGSVERYLSLNGTTGNNYFAYYSGTAQQTDLYLLPIVQEDSYTVKVKKPSNWGNTISAWVWKTGETGHWESVSMDGSWYVYTGTGEYNIIFVNGTTWNGDNNQTIDIAVFSDKCMQIGSETSGKRSCNNISCDDDPEPSNCKSLPFSETFATSQGEFTIENVALDGLGYVWTFASGYGMKASAYVSSVNHPTESWLISPCLEFPEQSAITLTFDHVYRYTSAPTSDLTLLVSENYESGAPSTATWTPVAIPTYSSGSNWTFVNAGNINLNAYAGKNVTLAFRYKSSSSAAATWEIKNVSVTSSSLTTGFDEVLNPNSATKCIIDGHLFILRDGHKFTASGTMVE